MTKDIDFSKVPTFAQLPVKPGAPPDSCWGVFGDDDELGCLNFLTPAGVVEAARLVQSGKVFRLDSKVGFAEPPLFRRAEVAHRIVPLSASANDDVLDNYNTQEGSQWDGLGHMAHRRHKAYYNGVTGEQIKSGPDGRLGIQRWSDKFVGRGLMIDAYGFRKARGIPVNPLSDDCYSLAELQEALAAQGSTLTPGTVLLVRTGWMECYEACSPEQKRAIGTATPLPKVIGIEPSRALVAWLWDNRVAAIGTDCTSVEPLPFKYDELGDCLHDRTLSLLGLPLGELFVLAPLAEDCARDKRYEFMLVSAPMNIEGGIASPPNAVAIK